MGIRSLRPFYLGRVARAGVLLGFGATTAEAITEGLARLRGLLE
jgi:hypothetical protein